MRHYALTREIKAPANDQRWRDGRESDPDSAGGASPLLCLLSYHPMCPASAGRRTKERKERRPFPAKTGLVHPRGCKPRGGGEKMSKPAPDGCVDCRSFPAAIGLLLVKRHCTERGRPVRQAGIEPTICSIKMSMGATPRCPLLPVSPGCHRLRGNPLRFRSVHPRLPLQVSQVSARLSTNAARFPHCAAHPCGAAEPQPPRGRRSVPGCHPNTRFVVLVSVSVPNLLRGKNNGVWWDRPDSNRRPTTVQSLHSYFC